MRRSLMLPAALLLLFAAPAVTGGPLLLGAAMLSPALALALALWCGWYPGSGLIEGWETRRRRPARRAAPVSGLGWRRFGRSAPFCAAHGPLLGISLAVRPPPA